MSPTPKHRVFKDDYKQFLFDEVLNAFDRAFRERDRQARSVRGTKPAKRREPGRPDAGAAVGAKSSSGGTAKKGAAQKTLADAIALAPRPFDPSFVAMFGAKESAL